MKRKKYAYLFATTVLLVNVVTTPLTVIAETMQENPSAEVSKKEKTESQESKQADEEKTATETENKTEENTSEHSSIKEEQPAEVPATQEVTPTVEDEEEAPEGATNVEVETDAGTTTNQEVRLADWQTEDKGSYVLITQYTGSSTEIVVPNEIDGKPTKLRRINTIVFPKLYSVTSFKVLPREDGTKVGIESTNLSMAFRGATLLKTIDLSGLDTSNVTNMTSMFSECTNLSSLNLSSFDTSNVTDMTSMFSECTNLSSLNLSSFDTSNVTNMTSMFSNCRNLSSLDLSNFDTRNVTDMTRMFNECTNLSSLDLSNFDTRNVTDMTRMFNECTNLSSLDLSNFDTRNVTNMLGMFYNCRSLSSLDLSNFDTRNVTSMSVMFYNCRNLSSLDLSNFDTSNVTYTTNMFKNFSAIIKANDPKILNYDYEHSEVTPLSTPLLNANGGQFKDQKNSKYYFTKVAYTPEEFEQMNKLTAFEQFKKDNVPTKAGTKFKSWKLIEGNDSGAQNVYPDLYGAKYQAQWSDASVKVKYVFEDTGKEIHEAKEILGNIGESYDATTEEYKLNIDGYVLDESRLPENATGTFTKEPQEIVYYYKAAPLSLVNGSFEDPVISSPNLSPRGYYWQGFSSIPGWKTTGPYIELQKAGPSWPIPAVDGNQWTELNYDRDAALYQDIKTTPGDTLYWEVYHRGTDGTDTAAVEIGKPDGQLVEQQQMTTPKTAWKKYSGLYKVPEGQTMTRFQMRTIRSGSGISPSSYANSIDHVVFTNITSKITVNFVDESGKPIKNPQIIKGYKDQAYDLTEIMETPIPGYKLDESKIPEGIKGTFTEEAKEITLTYKPLDIHIPSEGEDNTKPGEISSYGIAYMPKQFQTNSTVLNDAGPQSIPVNKINRFDVGVRDLRNAASQWTLSAQLVWNKGKELLGSSIKTTNKTGVVMKNINNGIAPFNPDTDLIDSNNEVQGKSDVTITNVPTPIMAANNVSHNAVYNYNLGEVSLEIPEARTVQPGSYVGHVEWNLANTL